MNECEIVNDVLFITLKNRNKERVGVMKANAIHQDKLLNSTWSLSRQGYAVANIGGKKVRSHRLITSAPKEMVVDHINHDKLNNLDENLRICTQKENMRNRKEQHGVSFYKSRNKWRARIEMDGKEIFLGYFDTYDEALEVRLNGERQYNFGL